MLVVSVDGERGGGETNGRGDLYFDGTCVVVWIGQCSERADAFFECRAGVGRVTIRERSSQGSVSGC